MPQARILQYRARSLIAFKADRFLRAHKDTQVTRSRGICHVEGCNADQADFDFFPEAVLVVPASLVLEVLEAGGFLDGFAAVALSAWSLTD
jgi:hypothetical protein